MLEAEQAEFPHAARNLDLSQEYAARRCSRKKEEVTLADHILVPSLFVAESLIAAGVRANRIAVIPFGCEVNAATATKKTAGFQRRIILNVGQLSLRKGIPRLLRAWKRLGAHHTDRLRLVGNLHLNERFLAEYCGVFERVPQVSRKELRKHYGSAYAFVMPSAAEGLAVVITEALAHGLPLVASGNSGAAGFITNGEEGLIYPFGDDDKLCAALDRILSRPHETAEMGRAAHQLAQRWAWTHYRSAFRGLVLRLLEATLGSQPARLCPPFVIPPARQGVESLC